MGTAEEFASKLAAESTGATVVLAIPVKAEHMQNDNFGVLPPWDSPATLSLCPGKKWEYFTTGYRTFSPFHFSFHSHKVHEVPTIPWTCRQGISECTDEPRAILVAQCVPVGILVPWRYGGRAWFFSDWPEKVLDLFGGDCGQYGGSGLWSYWWNLYPSENQSQQWGKEKTVPEYRFSRKYKKETMIFELPLAIRQGAIEQDWNYPVGKAVLLSIRAFVFLLCVRGGTR